MNVSIGARWENFVDGIVKGGRYGSASEVVREGLRLVEEREAKLQALRETIQTALDEDVWHTWDEVKVHVEDSLADLPRGKVAE
jgi:antitoxin ParD1/3/4